MTRKILLSVEIPYCILRKNNTRAFYSGHIRAKIHTGLLFYINLEANVYRQLTFPQLRVEKGIGYLYRKYGLKNKHKLPLQFLE